MVHSNRWAFVLASTVGTFCASSRSARAEPWPSDSRPTARPETDATRDHAASSEHDASKKRVEHFRVGVLGGVGFPRPLAVEGLFRLERTVALGVEYSVLPTMMISGVETRFSALAADARVFPLQGPFFVGLRAGHQRLDASGIATVTSYGTVTESLRLDTTFVNPRLGFLWTFEPGLSIGIDAGVQIPLGTTSSNTLPAGSVASAEVNRVATSYGNKLLPTIDLIRIGFLL